MNKRKLYLLTGAFPYGQSEKPFILPELNAIKDSYDVTIITSATDTTYLKKEWETKLEEDIKVVRIPIDGITLLEYCKWFVLFWKNPECRKEVRDIISSRKIVVQKIWASMKYYAVAEYIFKNIQKMGIISKEERAIYYSFWYNVRILGMALHKEQYPQLKLVTRTHGGDLYNEREKMQRQPFKSIIDSKLDKVVFVCQYGYEYYLKHFAGDYVTKYKYQVSYLGSKPQAYHKKKRKNETLLLVSCANAKPLKRIEYIIKALALIDEYSIRWVHFGDGWKLEELKQLSKQFLGNKENIIFEFKGHVENSQVLSYYEENEPDCFITTSSTEGSPVSIQEALAFGIPVIGTTVGGIPDMIKNNGVLLAENPSIADVAAAIRTICSLTEEQYSEMCENSFELWKERFNQEENAKRFVKSLDQLYDMPL